MGIAIGGKPVNEFTDYELIAWLNEVNAGYKLRIKTLWVWLAIIRAFDEAGPPMTVRQVYYALVSKGIIPKTEEAYNQVGYHLVQMRRRGAIPYGFIGDNTRMMRKPDTYASLEQFLKISQDAYRRALWFNQNAYVEIWCEKDALAGVMFGVTERWDVPLMVTRGFPSETFVHDAAEAIKSKNKPAYLYYFGDYDPSGVAIPENTQAKLREFGAEFHFEQVAVTRDQIDQWNLPTRPTKRTDSRAKNWQGGSVELDAIPVPILRQLVERVIGQHIDQDMLEASLQVEEFEKETLRHFVNNFGLA